MAGSKKAGYGEQLEAWHKFNLLQKEYIHALAKASSRTVENSLLREFDMILRDELSRLPRTKKPSKTQLQAAVTRAAWRVVERIEKLISESMKKAYLGGMDDVSRETGIQIQFGGIHEKALAQAISGEGMATTYANFSKTMATKFNDIIENAYLKGRVSIGEIVSQMVDEVGWQHRGRLERIARTETFKIWETARSNSYREAEITRGVKFKYKFGRDLGPTKKGHVQCPVCTDIIKNIPEDGLELDILIKHIVGISKKYNPGWNPMRDGNFPIPHPNCRHGHYRHVEV